MRLFWQERQRSVRMRWVLGVWIGFTVAAGIKVLVQPTAHTVYPVFAEGARNWWQDRCLYEPSPDRDLYRYSPTFAVLMTPFALWPDCLGGLFWQVGNILLLWVVLDRTAGEIFPGIDTPERKAVWLLLTLAGSTRGLWAGQSNSLVLVLAIVALWAIGRRRWWLAAVLLAGGGFIKVWPWALALLAAACWPRQLMFRLGVAVLVWAAIPFLTRPPETVLWQYQEWFQMLHTTQIYRWGGYRDAWTIWELIRSPVPRETYELVQSETALAVLAWCLWQRQQLWPELGDRNISVGPREFTSETGPEAHRTADAPATAGLTAGSAEAAISDSPSALSTGDPGGAKRLFQNAVFYPETSPIGGSETTKNPNKTGILVNPKELQTGQGRPPATHFGRASKGDSGGRFGRLAVDILGAWSAWQLLFGPGSERLTYSLIAPMSAWAVLASWRSGRYRAWAMIGWILITLFSMGAFERLVLRLTPWGRALLPLGVAVFAVWVILHETAPGPLWRKKPTQSSENIPKRNTLAE